MTRLLLVGIAALFALSTIQPADAKKAKKAPTQQCKPYGDSDVPQMCGQTK